MATRKNLRFKKKTSFKKKGRKAQNKKRNYKKTKKCGCSIKFFGGKKQNLGSGFAGKTGQNRKITIFRVLLDQLG